MDKIQNHLAQDNEKAVISSSFPKLSLATGRAGDD